MVVLSKTLVLAALVSLAAALPYPSQWYVSSQAVWNLDDASEPESYYVDPSRVAGGTPRFVPGFYGHMLRKQREYQKQQEKEQQKEQHASAKNITRHPKGGAGSKHGHDMHDPAFVTMPLDHFDNSTDAHFNLRYFYSLRHYKPASKRRDGSAVPVYILDSGESDAEARLAYLDTGILDILARETGGIGIVLEHRFYGQSIPNRTDLGPGKAWGAEQLRLLNHRQALEDSAEFIRRLNISGTENGEKRKVIYYGGSYPGARSAHMRLLYPDLVFGAIASSAVVAAIDEFPEYYYVIARGAEPACSQAIQAAIASIDTIIAPDPHGGSVQPGRNATKTAQLFDLFGVTGLENPNDFANMLTWPLGSFQGLNWNPDVSSTEWADFCHTLTTYGSSSKKGYPRGSKSHKAVKAGLDVPREVHAYAKFMRDQYVKDCVSDGSSPNDCFSTDVSDVRNETTLSTGVAWTWQVCTQWGYMFTAPPVPSPTKEGTGTFIPSGPKLVSTLLDYKYAQGHCPDLFPNGGVPPRPKVDEINRLGAFNISVDRLAFVDGQYDPWRPATVHSEEFAYGGARADTLDRPFKLIPDCWHHCDENGVKDPKKTPERVRQIHKQQIHFVKHWLKQD